MALIILLNPILIYKSHYHGHLNYLYLHYVYFFHELHHKYDENHYAKVQV